MHNILYLHVDMQYIYPVYIEVYLQDYGRYMYTFIFSVCLQLLVLHRSELLILKTLSGTVLRNHLYCEDPNHLLLQQPLDTETPIMTPRGSTCAYTCVRTCLYMHVYECVYTCAYVHTYTQLHLYTYIYKA